VKEGRRSVLLVPRSMSMSRREGTAGGLLVGGGGVAVVVIVAVAMTAANSGSGLHGGGTAGPTGGADTNAGTAPAKEATTSGGLTPAGSTGTFTCTLPFTFILGESCCGGAAGFVWSDGGGGEGSVCTSASTTISGASAS
jgi:hypothetical protein